MKILLTLFMALLAVYLLALINYGAWKMPEKKDFFNVLILTLTLMALVGST